MDKHKLILPISILLGCIILGGFYYASEASKRRAIEKQRAIQLAENKIMEEGKKCKFNLADIKESRYQEDKEAYSGKCSSGSSVGGYQSIFSNLYCDNGVRNYPARHYTYWEVDGMLKNKSNKNQYLKSIILKIYTDDEKKILLSEGYLDVRENLTPNQSYPFQIRTNINRDDEIGKYFNKDDKVKIDVYPYFASCNY